VSLDNADAVIDGCRILALFARVRFLGINEPDRFLRLLYKRN
jgi:hypothetical protein